MLLTIEPDGPVPIYQQIRDRIVEAIADGHAPAGSTLPSTRQLAVDLGVNFHTINKSYDLLRQEGLVRLNRKSGAVIQRDPASGPPASGYTREWTARLRTLLAEAAAQGMAPEAIVGSCRSAVGTFAFPATSENPAPAGPAGPAGPDPAGPDPAGPDPASPDPVSPRPQSEDRS